MQEFGKVSEVAMSDAEAQEVLRLHMKRSEGSPQLSVTDVAEAIRLPEDEVQRLLAEVRENKRADSVRKGPPAVRKRKVRDVVIASAAGVIFLSLPIAFWMYQRNAVVAHAQVNEAAAVATPQDSSYVSTIETEEISSPEFSGPGLLVTFNGHKFSIPAKVDPENMSSSKDLFKVLSRSIEDRLAYIQAGYRVDERQLLKTLQTSQNWDVQGMNFAPLILQVPGSDISVQESIPWHWGTYRPLQDYLRQEREKRLQDMLEMIATKKRLADGLPDKK